MNPAWETCAACQRPLSFDWRWAWQRLANITVGIEPGDPRLPALLKTLDRCDTAFLSGDGAAFRDAARQVEQVLTEQPPQSRQASPEPPLRPGWMIAYRDQRNRLQDGTVEHCALTLRGWSVHLTTGQTIPLPWVRSVRKTDAEGKVIAAWDTRAHGYDGEGMGRS